MVGEPEDNIDFRADAERRAAQLAAKTELQIQIQEKIRLHLESVCHGAIGTLLSGPSTLSAYIQSCELITQLIDQAIIDRGEDDTTERTSGNSFAKMLKEHLSMPTGGSCSLAYLFYASSCAARNTQVDTLWLNEHAASCARSFCVTAVLKPHLYETEHMFPTQNTCSPNLDSLLRQIRDQTLRAHDGSGRVANRSRLRHLEMLGGFAVIRKWSHPDLCSWEHAFLCV